MSDELTCRCDHPRTKHVMGTARCAAGDAPGSKPCGCVRFELPPETNLLFTAVALDERLELVERELRIKNELLKDLLTDMSKDDKDRATARALENNRRLRLGIQRIVGDPLSSRVAVQGALLELMR